MEGKMKGGNTTKVIIEDKHGAVIEVTNRKEIDTVMARENEKMGHQTEGGSQLLTKDYITCLGNHGEGPDVQEVLDGTFKFPPNTTDATKDFITACKYNPEVDTVNIRSTNSTRYKDVKRLWSIRKEKTCTYGKHIGHYKAVMQHAWLSWLFFQKGDIPAKSGYAPRRHKKCVDLMIMKKTNDFNYSAQRKLGILDTEFNNNNKLVARETRDNGLQLGAIAEEQFSRKGRSAIEDTLSKRLFIDHQQSQRRCFALTSSDLGGCYDRIIHTAAAVALLRIGVSKKKYILCSRSYKR